MDIWNYDPTTGELLSSGTADPSPLQPGVFLVPRHATTIAPMPAQPGLGRYWSGMAWELRAPAVDEPPVYPPPPTLAEVKVAAHATVDAALQVWLDAGVAYGGYPFDSDATSRANLAAVVAGIAADMEFPDDFTWRTADNIDVPASATFILSLSGVMLRHVTIQYRRSWGLKAEIDAAARAVDVAALIEDLP